MPREPHVLSALKDKRARVAGELEQAKLRVVALTNDLANVDGCLRIFHSDIDPEAIPAKVTLGTSPVGLPKGAGTRTALAILRETGEAMSTPELAACVLQRYGRPLEARALTMLVKSIQGNFSRHKKWLVEFDRDSYPGKWRLSERLDQIKPPVLVRAPLRRG
jgi:hypothetical protein